VQAFLVPAFRHAQFHARPLVHHRNGQRVELLFASLENWKNKTKTKNLIITNLALSI
jgi:hypothetical protein